MFKVIKHRRDNHCEAVYPVTRYLTLHTLYPQGLLCSLKTGSKRTQHREQGRHNFTGTVLVFQTRSVDPHKWSTSQVGRQALIHYVVLRVDELILGQQRHIDFIVVETVDHHSVNHFAFLHEFFSLFVSRHWFF